MAEIDELRKLCWDKAVEAFGTGYIFEKRMGRYRFKLRFLSFLGIVAPITVGAIFLSFGNVVSLSYVSISAGVLSVIQLVFSVWSLTARWDESYSYSMESMNSNYRLADCYGQTAKNPPNDITDLEMKIELLDREDMLRRTEDNKQGIKDSEKRMGMRAGLRSYQRPCAYCHEVPQSMKVTDCPTCGQF